VARNCVVIFTFDPDHSGTWLGDYLPQLRELDRQQMPPLTAYRAAFRDVTIEPVPIPYDCRDGFLHAYCGARTPTWIHTRARRQFLFPCPPHLAEGLVRLQTDLASGRWEKRYTHLLALDEFDAGYRLVTARF
jgi:hypothetical protein